MFHALGTILKWVILLPILAVVVLLSVANDQSVTVHLNPFDKADAVLKVDTPRGTAWRRYNGDGYGEHADGRPFVRPDGRPSALPHDRRSCRRAVIAPLCAEE